MTQKIESPAEFHADHRRWTSEISMWRDDIELWQKEREGSLKALEYAIELLRKDEGNLLEHIAMIDKIESSLDYHEKNLAESLKGASDGESDLDKALADRHTNQEREFAQQRKKHEQIKKRNHIAVAQITSMLTALSLRDNQ